MSNLPMAPNHEIRDGMAEHSGWHVMANADHTMADVLHPTYLWHGAARMLPGQFVWIQHPKRKFLVQLYIVDIDHATNSVRCEKLLAREIGLDKLPLAELTNAKVTWGGPEHKHRVVHGSTVLKHGFDTKEDAEAWLAEQRAKPGQKVAA